MIDPRFIVKVIADGSDENASVLTLTIMMLCFHNLLKIFTLWTSSKHKRFFKMLRN